MCVGVKKNARETQATGVASGDIRFGFVCGGTWEGNMGVCNGGQRAFGCVCAMYTVL